jgi:hypothetical protein
MWNKESKSSTRTTTTRRSLGYIFLLALFLSAPLLFLFAGADYFDGFETYNQTGLQTSESLVISPNNQGWKFQGYGCSLGPGYTQGAVTASVTWNGNTIFAAPGNGTQFFEMSMPGNCGMFSTLGISLIATSSAPTVSAVIFTTNNTGSGGTIDLCFVGSVGPSGGLCVDPYATWQKFTASYSATPGQLMGVTFECFPNHPYGNNQNFCLVDTVKVTGAILVNYPTNLQLQDWANKPNLFDIYGLGGLPSANSKVSLSYTSAQPKTFSNITSPTLNLPYSQTNTSLITVSVGNYYSRTIIPCTSVNCQGNSARWHNTTMYLDPPYAVNSYLFQFQDLTGKIVAGDVITIGIGGLNITTGYLDASRAFQTWLRTDTYSVQVRNVTNGAILFNSQLAVSPQNPGTQTLIQVEVSNATSTPINTDQSQVSVGINLINPTTVQVSFNDGSGATTMVNATLFLQNITGNFNLGTLCASTSAHGSCVVVSSIGNVVLGSFILPNMNVTSGLYIMFTFINPTLGGIVVIGGYPVIGGSILPHEGTTNNCIFGACYVLTASFNSTNDVILDFISIAILIFIACVFSARNASFGALLLSIITGIFYGANWISLNAIALPAGLITLFAALAVLSFVHAKEKEAANIYSASDG